MKYLLVFAVVFVAVWLWRKNRREEMQSRAAAARPRRPSARRRPWCAAPTAVCTCRRADAIAGPDGASTAAPRTARPAGT